MAGNLVEFTDESLEQTVAQSPLPVLVDFWAPWCGPCRMIAPVIDELANENQGAVTIGKINVDDYQGAAQTYGVSNIPTLIVFKDGRVHAQITGIQPKSKLQSILDEVKA